MALRKWTALALLLAMLASLTAAGAAENKFATPVYVSTNTVDAEKAGVSAIDDYVREKFNIFYEFIPVTWGDWREKTNTWVAADDMPDILWWDMKIQDAGQFQTWARQGAFKPFPSDLSPWPNLKAWYDKMESPKALMTVDGTLFGWAATRNNPEWIQNTYQGVGTYRRDWAKAVGLYKEGDVYTWEEAKALIDAVLAQDPGNNGKGQTLPITFESWAFPGTLMEALGYQEERSAYVQKEDGTWTPFWATPEYKQEVEFVVDLYKDGYVWKDQMLAQGSEGSDKFRAGQVFLHWGNSNGGWITDCYDIMTKSGVIDDIGDISPMLILSPKDDQSFWLSETEDYWSVSCFNHNMDDATMTRVLDFWDWLASPEGCAFRALGVPGKDFTANGDGTYNLNWPKSESGDPVDPYAESFVSKFYLRQPGWYGSFPETSRKDTDTLFTSLRNFMTDSPNFRIHQMNWDVATFRGPNFLQYGNYRSDATDKVKALCGFEGDVGAEWDAFVAEYLQKVAPVVAEFNEAFK
jgi:putative aldouronate transport system substrate-binding protein